MNRDSRNYLGHCSPPHGKEGIKMTRGFKNKLMVTHGGWGKREIRGLGLTYTHYYKENNQQGPGYSTGNSTQYAVIT